MRRTSALSLTGVVLLAFSLAAQSPVPLDPAVIARVREEATVRSQAHDHVWWLSEVYGPRVTGTPAFAQASEWAMKQFTAWGLANVHQERWAFGQGWTIERFSATMTARSRRCSSARRAISRRPPPARWRVTSCT
jgi:hypothetical protein